MITEIKSARLVACMILVASIIFSCTYDSRNETIAPCITDQPSFTSTVKPILVNNCLVCHSTSNASGGLNFETYAGIFLPASDGRLVGCIKHLAGFEPMPQFAPKLSDCEIAKIDAWVKSGAPNN